MLGDVVYVDDPIGYTAYTLLHFMRHNPDRSNALIIPQARQHNFWASLFHVATQTRVMGRERQLIVLPYESNQLIGRRLSGMAIVLGTVEDHTRYDRYIRLTLLSRMMEGSAIEIVRL